MFAAIAVYLTKSKRLVKSLASRTKKLDELRAGRGIPNDDESDRADVSELTGAAQADLSRSGIGFRLTLFTLVQVTPEVLEVGA